MAEARVVLPVSHQFANFPRAFVERFATVEFHTPARIEPWATDALVHTHLSLVQPDFGDAIDFAALERAPVRRFSFDIGPCYRHTTIVDAQYVGQGDKLSPAQVLDLAEQSLDRVRHRFPPGCELAFENLNFYPTGAYDGVCDAAFCNEAGRRLGIGMVLDVAHARVTAANMGSTFAAFADELDLANVREIHLSRPGRRTDGLAVDLHDQPQAEEFAILADLLARITGRVDVVIEYYRDVDGIVAAYDRLFEMLGQS